MVAEFGPTVERALRRATYVAKRTGSYRVRPQHLVVALLAEPESGAAHLLADIGTDFSVLQRGLLKEVNSGSPAEYAILGKDSMRVLASSWNEAFGTGRFPVESERLLLALTEPLFGGARGFLRPAGITRRKVRKALRSEQPGGGPTIDEAAIAWVWDLVPAATRSLTAAWQARCRGDMSGAVVHYEEAVELAKDDAISDEAGAVYAELIDSCLHAGQRVQAARWLDEAEAYLVSHPPSPRTTVSDIEDAEGVHRAAELRTTEFHTLQLNLMISRVKLHLGADEHSAARAAADELFVSARELNHPQAEAAANGLLGDLLTLQGGDDDEARRRLKARGGSGRDIDLASERLSLARLALFRGDLSNAIALGTAAKEAYVDLNLGWSTLHADLIVGEARARQGEVVSGATLVAATEIDPTGAVEFHPWALRVAAIVEQQRNPADAVVAASGAVTICRREGLRLALCLSLLEQGRAEHAAGSTDNARRAFVEAHDLATQLEVRFAADARRELADLAE